jgi:hypothetical protein
MAVKANYAINPTPELDLRSNRALLPARVIAALGFVSCLDTVLVIDRWLSVGVGWCGKGRFLGRLVLKSQSCWGLSGRGEAESCGFLGSEGSAGRVVVIFLDEPCRLCRGVGASSCWSLGVWQSRSKSRGGCVRH